MFLTGILKFVVIMKYTFVEDVIAFLDGVVLISQWPLIKFIISIDCSQKCDSIHSI